MYNNNERLIFEEILVTHVQRNLTSFSFELNNFIIYVIRPLCCKAALKNIALFFFI